MGLKAVAEMVMQHGCVLYHEAAERFVNRRHTLFADLNAALDADGVDEGVRYQSPAWTRERAGNELLARLPLARRLPTSPPRSSRRAPADAGV